MRDCGVLVYREQVPAVWPQVEHFIRLTDGYRSTADDLYPLLLNGDRQLWLCVSRGQIVGACISRVVEYPQSRAVLVTTLGGCGGDWVQMLEDVEQFARASGCARVEVQGRYGWVRKLDGYAPVSATLSKEVG
jgi:hypothetical protein